MTTAAAQLRPCAPVAASLRPKATSCMAPAGVPRGAAAFLGSSAPLSARRAAAAAARLTRSAAPATRAMLAYKEQASGVEFPLVQKLWLGEDMRCVGAGCRSKKVAFIGVKVYAVALYVEAEKMARELGVRNRGGFFEGDDDYCQALIDGGCVKALQLQLLRDVEGAQFVEAIEDALAARMRLMGDTSSLDQFKKFFLDKKLTKDTNVVLMYRTDGTLDVAVRPGRVELSTLVADLSVTSAGLCRGLFEIFLGSSSVVPDARKEWAAGARKLLESDDIRRQTRKGGSG
ncbi:chalcone-flavanone isomerase [Micractinium conductrix]|uniref:Chalcone-flavonone isomerase family protein n=1 Tax=Micractinium conductrix TaxID=554055 RepID=A0A2P6VJM5_9CHLO|nr:chalcone-flavanone isomerase [Micractinium conductrix]|eukprot:PSC74267.1 chalcone-flavanone isomerase [Micractinium conductrix]